MEVVSFLFVLFSCFCVLLKFSVCVFGQLLRAVSYRYLWTIYNIHLLKRLGCCGTENIFMSSLINVGRLSPPERMLFYDTF